MLRRPVTARPRRAARPGAALVVALALGPAMAACGGSDEAAGTVPATAPTTDAVTTTVDDFTPVTEGDGSGDADGSAATTVGDDDTSDGATTSGDAETSGDATTSGEGADDAADDGGSPDGGSSGDDGGSTGDAATSEGDGSTGDGADEAPADGSFTLDTFAFGYVDTVGLESIGCWFHRSGDAPDSPVLFSGYDGGLVVVDGEPVTLQPDGGTPVVVVDDASTLSGGGYTVSFSGVGEPEPTSDESTDQDLTITVTDGAGRSTTSSGTLSCGV